MYTHEELAAAGLDDFRVFLCLVWDALGLPKPTPVQLDIAWYLQHGPRRKGVMAFRGVGKSWITVAFVLWTLLVNPQAKVLVVSATQALADDFTKFCKQLLHLMPILHHLLPRQEQRNSAIAFDVGPATPSKDPSVKSVGITGQITGSRSDLIVADDVEIPKNSLSHLLRGRLAESVKEFDAVLKPGGQVVYLGTPQIEASLYMRLMRDRGYDFRVWPAEIPAKLDIYHNRLAPIVQRRIERGWKPGTPLDSSRFDVADLLERKASYGPAGYALQFLLDTTPADAARYPLRLRDLIVHDCDPDMGHAQLVWGGAPDLVIQDLDAGGLDGDCYNRCAWKSPEMTRYTASVLAIDPSGSGQDETAYAVVKYLHGMLYLMDVGGYLDGFGEATLKALAGKALRWGVNDIVIEKNFGGGMFDQLLRPHLISVGLERQHAENLPDRPPAGKIDDEWAGWSRGQKELRICDTLEPVLTNHKLVVHRRVIEEDWAQQREAPQYSLVQQLTRMTRVRGALAHEDRVEAVSMACAYFTDRMHKDQKRAAEAHKGALLDAELRKYMDHVVGIGGRRGGYRGTTGNFRWAHRRRPHDTSPG